VLLVATDEQLLRAPAEGGTPTVVVAAAEGVTYADPAFLPDGTHFTYRQISRGAKGGATAMLASLDGGAPRRLFPAETRVEYVDPGVVLAGDGTHVYAYPFDLERLEVAGQRFLAFEGAIWFSASQTGDVAYRREIRQESQLNWVDRAGGLLGAVGEKIGGGEVELSPDGRFAAIVANDQNVWLTDTARGVASRFTSGPTLERWPTWSPDSTRLMFAMRGNLMVSDTTGAAMPSIVLEDSFTKLPSDWSPDGRYVLYFVQRPPEPGRSASRGDIWFMPVDKSRAPEPLIATAAEESHAQFSPDGKWVSYDSDESGRVEVYVSPFQGTGARVRVSADGGVAARWNPRGGELFFISPDGNLMSAAARSAGNGAALEVERPKRMFPLRTWTGGTVASGRKIDYDVASDGNRFLVLQRGSDNAGWPIHVVANWQPRQSEASR